MRICPSLAEYERLTQQTWRLQPEELERYGLLYDWTLMRLVFLRWAVTADQWRETALQVRGAFA